MIEKIPCKKCNALILPSTSERTNGLCMSCYKSSSSERVSIGEFLPVERSKENFFRKHWLGLIGLVVGILGIILSIYFYSLTKQYRDLVFISDPHPATIISQGDINNSPLKLVKNNSVVISNSIFLHKIYIWNEGNLSIRRDHILRPISIVFGDSSTSILDYKILRESRDVVNLNVSQNSSNKIEIDFDILEQNDGFCMQLLIEADRVVYPIIEGNIEGIKKISRFSDFKGNKVTMTYLKNLIFYFFIPFASAMLIVFILNKFADYLEYYLYEVNRVFNWFIMSIIFLSENIHRLIYLGYIIYVLVFLFWSNSKAEVEKNYFEVIPIEILETDVMYNNHINPN